MKEIRAGFTLVELFIVLVIIELLAAITAVSYGAWRHSIDDSAVRNDLTHATTGLVSYANFQSTYPPNLAGVNFAPSQNTALVLYTNAPSIGIYQGLTADQNAQLLLNVCNANLIGTQTVCTFAGTGVGAKIHVKGTGSTNLNWISPITQSIISGLLGLLGSLFSNSANTIISQFTAQGGTFPVYVSGNTASLPAPTQSPNGPATRFCLEARSGEYPDIVYHTSETNTYLTQGACPSDPSLHYYTSGSGQSLLGGLGL